MGRSAAAGGPWSRLTDGQAPLVGRFGLRVVALGIIERCQVVEAACRVGMLWTQHLLPDPEGPLDGQVGCRGGALVSADGWPGPAGRAVRLARSCLGHNRALPGC